MPEISLLAAKWLLATLLKLIVLKSRLNSFLSSCSSSAFESRCFAIARFYLPPSSPFRNAAGLTSLPPFGLAKPKDNDRLVACRRFFFERTSWFFLTNKSNLKLYVIQFLARLGNLQTSLTMLCRRSLSNPFTFVTKGSARLKRQYIKVKPLMSLCVSFMFTAI